MDIEEFIRVNSKHSLCEGGLVIKEHKLSEFMKGKVVLPFDVVESAQSEIAMEVVECENAKEHDINLVARWVRLQKLSADLWRALQPTSSEAGSTTTESVNERR